MLDHTNHHSISLWQILVESNLLNVLILALAFIYLGNKFLPKIIDQRKKQISKELEDAKLARIKANEELEIVRRKTQNLTREIEEIKAEAQKTAQTIKNQIGVETEEELEQLNLKIKREISSSREEAVNNVKRSASDAALKLAEEALTKVSNNHEVQKKLMEDFLADLKKPSKN